MRLQRVVMSEAERFADLGALLHREVIARAESRVANYLLTQGADANTVGGLARLFVNMTTGPQRFATLLQAREPAPHHPSLCGPGLDRDWIAEAVDFFLLCLERTKEKTGT